MNIKSIEFHEKKSIAKISKNLIFIFENLEKPFRISAEIYHYMRQIKIHWIWWFLKFRNSNRNYWRIYFFDTIRYEFEVIGLLYHKWFILIKTEFS